MIKGSVTRLLGKLDNKKKPLPTLTVTLPGGGPGNGSACVHQHTPAVTCGLVALDRLVETPGPTVRDEDGLAGVLPRLIQGALSLLVTRGNFL